MAEMMVLQLMQRLEKLVRSTMVLMQVIATFVLDLRASAVSMLFSEQTVRSLECSLSIIEVFCLERNRERSMEFASLLSKVTPSVARFPCGDQA